MAQRTCDVAGCERKHRARGMCSTHYNQHHVTAEQRHPHEVRHCAVCDARVIRRADSRYTPTCSVACRNMVALGQIEAQTNSYTWRKDACSRAAKLGCELIEPFDRETVFERDDWICYLCGDRCEPPDPFNVKAATIDHVVAYANGGSHTAGNARTCCLGCNSAKQAAEPLWGLVRSA